MRTDWANSKPISSGTIRATYVAKSGIIAFLAVFMIVLARLGVYVPSEGPRLLVCLAWLVPQFVVIAWRGDPPRPLLWGTVAADVVAFSANIHLAGGVEAVSGPMAYIALIAFAGVVLTEQGALLSAFSSMAAYAFIVWAEQRGMLDHVAPYTRSPDRQVSAVIAVSVGLLAMGFMVMYAVRRFRRSRREIEQARTEAIHALVHDVRNPLTIVQGFATILDDEVTSPTHRDYLRGIQRAAEDASNLVLTVLDASAEEERPLVPHWEDVNLNQLVEEVLEPYRLMAKERRLTLRIDLSPDTPVVRADPALLRRAIGNLLSNAFKFTPAGGSVEVISARHNTQARVSVRDTGPGIAPHEQGALFQKFRRTSSGRDVSGIGLGLYIVRRIVEAHGASVHLESQAGAGSTFTIDIPAGQLRRSG